MSLTMKIMKLLDYEEKFNQAKPRGKYLDIRVPEQHRMYLKDPMRKSPPIQKVSEYRAVLNFIFERIWFYMFSKEWIFTAPLSIGQFFVAAGHCKYYTDWQETRRTGKVVKKYNMHTDGKSFFIKYDRTLSKGAVLELYGFKPHRGYFQEGFIGSRGLSRWIQHCQNDPYLPDLKGHIVI